MATLNGDGAAPSVRGSHPTRMRPVRWRREADGREYPARYEAVEQRNGLPVRPYRYGGTGLSNCLVCELWLGCGGVFCARPIMRALAEAQKAGWPR